MPKLGRPKTDQYWRERVEFLVENEGLGPRPLTRRLEQEAAQLGRDDAPAERTVARLRNEFIKSDEPTKRASRAFLWPESMGTPELPWEAGATALEILGYLRQHPSPGLPWERPTIGFVTWFWRVTLAAPTASAIDRVGAATELYAAERRWRHDGFRPHLRRREWFLAFAPWQSPEAQQAYTRAIEASAEGGPDSVQSLLSATLLTPSEVNDAPHK